MTKSTRNVFRFSELGFFPFPYSFFVYNRLNEMVFICLTDERRRLQKKPGIEGKNCMFITKLKALLRGSCLCYLKKL